jgi:hypothetical protein
MIAFWTGVAALVLSGLTWCLLIIQEAARTGHVISRAELPDEPLSDRAHGDWPALPADLKRPHHGGSDAR